jgi:HlyD family secretion protein
MSANIVPNTESKTATRRFSAGKLIGLLVGLVAVVSAVGFSWPYTHRSRTLTLPGTVEVQEVRLSSKVGGRIVEVLVAEGDRIEAGQPIVRFDAPELLARRNRLLAEISAAKAGAEKARNGPRPEEIAQARAAVAVAEAQLKLIQAPSRVEDIEQARAELDSLTNDLQRAETELGRWRKLVADGVGVQGDLDLQLAIYGRLSGQARAARAKLTRWEVGARLEEIAEAQARVDQSQANLNLMLAGTRKEDIAVAEAQVTSLEAQLADLQTQIDETVVRAAEPVLVEVVPVRAGEILAPNQPVVRVLREADLWVKAYVPETDLGRVRLNQAVHVTIDSHPGEKFPGEVKFIASASEFTPRNVQSLDERRHQVFGIKVKVTAEAGLFKPGMAADVLVPLK